MPRVAVIVPAHNAPGEFDETLASIAAQTYTDYELVVADDASSDDTAERAERGGARVVRAPANLGPAGARNLALASSSSELVAFLDADDLWLPAYLERQVAAYDEHAAQPGAPVGLVACDARVRRPGGDAAQSYLDGLRPPVHEITLERLVYRNCVFISTLVAARRRRGGRLVRAVAVRHRGPRPLDPDPRDGAARGAQPRACSRSTATRRARCPRTSRGWRSTARARTGARSIAAGCRLRRRARRAAS